MNYALLIFLFVAIVGTLMRLIYVTPIPFLDYKNLLHAHSHAALLGWAFMLTTAALIFYVFKENQGSKKKYLIVFILSLISSLGMLLFFTLYGYGVLSISFSTLNILTSYLFCYYAFQDLKQVPNSTSKRLIKWALFWMLISTLGLWMVGPIAAMAGKTSSYFYMAVQFFLHFQFNGWFTYAILGIWVFSVEKKNANFAIPNSYLWLLHISLILTYALSITWSNPLSIIFYLNSAGVILQGVAFYLIFKKIFQHSNPFRQLKHWTDWLFAAGVLCLILKVVVQVAVALPVVAEISYTIRNYVIGFIHLTMLGSITFPLIAILLKEGALVQNRLTRFGWGLFSVGFILKEITLFGQGTLLWLRKGFFPLYHETILVVTAILPIAILTVLIGQLAHKKIHLIPLTNTKTERL